MTEMTTLPWNELEKRFGRKKKTTFLKVGNYRIDLERKLGSGTFGEVRLAWDELREIQVVGVCIFVYVGGSELELIDLGSLI